LETYDGRSTFFADLHNHCNISYGHGSIEDALENGRQRLDVCSITGHAHWPDMPARDGKIDHIIDFHEKGFANLKKEWPRALEVMKRFNRDQSFLVFPSFEIHSMEAGDYTVLARDLDAEIIYPDSIEALKVLLRSDGTLRERLLPFPHHIGYKRGRRGINWRQFSEDFSPLVEIYSMHGCSEEDENDKPFLHTMGPLEGHGTMRFGLGRPGSRFGVLANTDHHSAHPGSYGHGLTGIWADRLQRTSVWDALKARRTFALSADKMVVAFSVNGTPMGSSAGLADSQKIEIDITAGGALDYVDVIKNGRLHARFSQYDVDAPAPAPQRLRTIIYFEAGWGERGVPCDWDVAIHVEGGRIDAVDARFRGDEVVSPLDAPEVSSGYFRSSWQRIDDGAIRFAAQTRSNPTNSTAATQGVAMRVDVDSNSAIRCSVNGKSYRVPIAKLLEASFVDYLGGFDSPAFKIHRAPLEAEYHWRASLHDAATEPAFYYLRARQKSGAWAWSSPVWVE
jgi:hypothetical protein